MSILLHYSTLVISKFIHEVVCFLKIIWLQLDQLNIYCPFHWMHSFNLLQLKSYKFIYLSGNTFVEDLFLPSTCWRPAPLPHCFEKDFDLYQALGKPLSFSLSESCNWAAWSICTLFYSFPSTALNTSPKYFYLVWNTDDTWPWILVLFWKLKFTWPGKMAEISYSYFSQSQ